MTYTITDWIGSKWVPESHENITEPGEYDIRILSADYDDNTSRYVLTFEDVRTKKQLTLSYWTRLPDGTMNNRTLGTLCSLGKALFGENVGVPFFGDIINGIVHVDIIQGKEFTRADGTTGHYLNCYSFAPVAKSVYDIVAMEAQTIEQFTLEG